jgi:hypothetical protein
VIRWSRFFDNPARIPCHNIALRANKGALSVELGTTVAEDLGEHHACCRRSVMEFSIRPKGPLILT